jgi:hypothetical protein
MSRQRPIQCEGHVLRQGDCQEQSSKLELTAGIITSNGPNHGLVHSTPGKRQEQRILKDAALSATFNRCRKELQMQSV